MGRKHRERKSGSRGVYDRLTGKESGWLIDVSV